MDEGAHLVGLDRVQGGALASIDPAKMSSLMGSKFEIPKTFPEGKTW